MLDMEASSLDQIADLILDNMISAGHLDSTIRDKVREALLRRHRHLHEKSGKSHHNNSSSNMSRLPIIRSLAEIGKSHSSSKSMLPLICSFKTNFFKFKFIIFHFYQVIFHVLKAFIMCTTCVKIFFTKFRGLLNLNFESLSTSCLLYFSGINSKASTIISLSIENMDTHILTQSFISSLTFIFFR